MRECNGTHLTFGRYQETIGILYLQNTFDVIDNEVILFLPHLLLPQRIDTMTTLRFSWSLKCPPSMLPVSYRTGDPVKEEKRKRKRNHYRDSWFRIWKNLSEMKGLKDLTVELDIPSDRMSEWTVQELEIAKSVTIPDDFLLVLRGDMAQRMRGRIGGPNCRTY